MMSHPDSSAYPSSRSDNPVAKALADSRAQLAAACAEANRAASEVHITAVSKKHTAETIKHALEAGHRLFGENRVQEALQKWPDLRAAYPDARVHLIGPLQSNKVPEAVQFFDAIETMDRPKLARALAGEMVKQGRRPALFVQVNTGEEPQKAGVAPGETDAFIDLCRRECGLVIAGLMCIPPMDEPPAPHFALLRKIADRNGVQGLSMGMSADYAIAAQLGATHVRIGSGVFGERPS